MRVVPLRESPVLNGLQMQHLLLYPMFPFHFLWILSLLFLGGIALADITVFVGCSVGVHSITPPTIRFHHSIIKHSLNNGAVLTMENKVLPNALKLGGFVH